VEEIEGLTVPQFCWELIPGKAVGLAARRIETKRWTIMDFFEKEICILLLATGNKVEDIF